MALTERGKIRNGSIEFSQPLPLPEGVDVVVRVEVVGDADGSAGAGLDAVGQSIYGMWSDREDMADSARWTRDQRESWQSRLMRQE